MRGVIFEDAGGFVACQATTDYQPSANVWFRCHVVTLRASHGADIVGSDLDIAV